jgi:hypothetical protein
MHDLGNGRARRRRRPETPPPSPASGTANPSGARRGEASRLGGAKQRSSREGRRWSVTRGRGGAGVKGL